MSRIFKLGTLPLAGFLLSFPPPVLSIGVVLPVAVAFARSIGVLGLGAIGGTGLFEF